MSIACRSVVAGLVSGLIAASGAQAASVDRFTSLLVFGDSLSDTGNLFELTNGAVPETPPYFMGRRSNGPIWADGLAADFAAEGLRTANYAYAFGNALTNVDPFPFQVPDLEQQIALFKADGLTDLGVRPVATLWFGANDVFGQIADNPDPVAVGSTATLAAQAVAQGVLSLGELGIKDFRVFNLPALEKTPQFNLLTRAAAPLAKIGSDVFNATLDGLLAALQGEGVNVERYDMFAEFNALIANPAALGLTDATNPCINPQAGTICSPELASLLAFFDPVHPNTVVHSRIADVVRAEIAPVPLPAPIALLMVAVAGLGLVRRRQTS